MDEFDVVILLFRMKPEKGGGKNASTHPMLRAVWQLFAGGNARKRQFSIATVIYSCRYNPGRSFKVGIKSFFFSLG